MFALAGGPVRSRRVTERLAPYTPRTVYRQLAKLVSLGVVERSEEGGPSPVHYRLTRPSGQSLCRLLRRNLDASQNGEPAQAIDEAECTSLYLLAEAWDAGWLGELGSEGRTATEIAESTPGWTFHQVSRRIHLLRMNGLLCESRQQGRGRRYQMTDRARRTVAVLLEIARWQRRYLLRSSAAQATVPETGVALKALAPLVRIPAHSGRSIKLGIAGGLGNGKGRGAMVLHVTVDEDGLRWVEDPGLEVDAWAIGTAHTWIAAILDGRRGRMRIGGDPVLVDAFLKQLNSAAEPS